jgi:hypothetical protein
MTGERPAHDAETDLPYRSLATSPFFARHVS